MDVLGKPVILLGLAMVLSLIVERLLEIIKSIHDYIAARADGQEYWTRQAEKMRDRLEVRLENAKTADAQHFDLVLSMASKYFGLADAGHNGRMAVSADKVRSIFLKGRYKFVSILLGLGCAVVFNIDVMALVKLSLEKELTLVAYDPHWFGIVLAGIAIGLGTGPMHKLITALENARNMRRQTGGQKNGDV